MNTSPRQENESAREYVTRLMETAVNMKGPDYVYRVPDDRGACVYINDGQPSCLVGHVLVAAGVPVERLEVWEDTAAREVVGHLGPDDWDYDLGEALNRAQETQDSGAPWGEALAAFKEALEE